MTQSFNFKRRIRKENWTSCAFLLKVSQIRTNIYERIGLLIIQRQNCILNKSKRLWIFDRSKEDIEKGKTTVRSSIITHLDEHYHKIVVWWPVLWAEQRNSHRIYNEVYMSRWQNQVTLWNNWVWGKEEFNISSRRHLPNDLNERQMKDGKGLTVAERKEAVLEEENTRREIKRRK